MHKCTVFVQIPVRMSVHNVPYGFIYLEGMEQQQIQERGAQSGDQRDDGEVLRGLLPLPVLRLAHRRMRGAFTLQDLHLRGVSEKGAGRRQEDGEEGWASQFSAVDCSCMAIKKTSCMQIRFVCPCQYIHVSPVYAARVIVRARYWFFFFGSLSKTKSACSIVICNSLCLKMIVSKTSYILRQREYYTNLPIGNKNCIPVRSNKGKQK